MLTRLIIWLQRRHYRRRLGWLAQARGALYGEMRGLELAEAEAWAQLERLNHRRWALDWRVTP